MSLAMSDNFTTCPICYSITTYTFVTDHMNWHAERGEIEYPERSEIVDFEVNYEDSF
jgi:hypothetical protein